MIVSHKHKFIYIKACKVAGTSVQKALEKICGQDDIVVDEHFESGDNMYNQHSTPEEVRSSVGEDVWNSYRKIVIIRNPWDALVSLYFFGHVSQKLVDMPAFFKTFVRWNLAGSMPLNKNFMLLDGKRWADDYIRFENLDQDCSLLFGKLGEPYKGLGREVSGHRPNIHYSLMYDNESMEFVARRYEAEIKEFGYSFDHVFSRKTSKNKDNMLWRV